MDLELEAGIQQTARLQRNRRALAHLLGDLRVWPMDLETARLYGEIHVRLRQQGLDTIYVFSDGLPNIGAGLSPEAARTLKESDRSEILSKYIRQKLKIEWNRGYAGQRKVRINTVGFFYESPDVGAFLWALARENDGSFVGMSKP